MDEKLAVIIPHHELVFLRIGVGLEQQLVRIRTSDKEKFLFNPQAATADFCTADYAFKAHGVVPTERVHFARCWMADILSGDLSLS